MRLRALWVAICAGVLAAAQLCAAQSPVLVVDHGPNALLQAQKHYVVLVSLDGFRWDYAKKYGAKNLLAMAAHGASAPDGMLPSYPSLTFPNHYTLVTGLYPEHHGIVANSFYDQQRHQRYSYSDPKESSDGSWYGGMPLWVLAEQQGMRSACFFWPGSEAAIRDTRPSYYLHYDDKFPDQARIDQVLAWLKLPEAERPHFITLYYPNVDHAGHQFGPEAPETRDAVHHVDALMGTLRAGLRELHLPIDLVVVSDHGMEKTQLAGTSGWINLDTYADLGSFTVVGSLLYANADADAEAAYQKLKAADASFLVYRRARVPAYLHYDSNPRIGDPVVVPKGPFAIRAHAPSSAADDKPPSVGSHGYDPREMASMKAIFYAEGPDIRPGTKLKPFENVNVYPLLAHILGLSFGQVDGSLSVLSNVLVEPAP